MVNLSFLVEGQTEEIFVKKVIKPHLTALKIKIPAIVLVGGTGGDVSLRRVSNDLNKLVQISDYVTTLFDFYGFKGLSKSETKLSLENKILKTVNIPLQNKIIPYVQMYEFEGLLFSSPYHMKQIINTRNLQSWASEILRDFDNNPEAINNSRTTAPSKRLKRKGGYGKRHGPKIAQTIGLKRLRKKCSGFNTWLLKLETL